MAASKQHALSITGIPFRGLRNLGQAQPEHGHAKRHDVVGEPYSDHRPPSFNAARLEDRGRRSVQERRPRTDGSKSLVHGRRHGRGQDSAGEGVKARWGSSGAGGRSQAPLQEARDHRAEACAQGYPSDWRHRDIGLGPRALSSQTIHSVVLHAGIPQACPAFAGKRSTVNRAWIALQDINLQAMTLVATSVSAVATSQLMSRA